MRIYVKVVPRSSLNKVEPARLGNMGEGDYKVKLTAPPVDGEANSMLIQILAKHFGVPKSSLRIVAGKTARVKLVEIY